MGTDRTASGSGAVPRLARVNAAEGTVVYRVLGPLQVMDGRGETVALRGERQRRLVAALLLHANRPLGLDALGDRLWGDRLPDDLAGAVQTHVSRVRRLLPGGTLVTGEGGYSLDVPAGAVDSDRFSALVADGIARRAADPERAVALFDAALALWRGTAFGEFADWDDARAEASRLDELQALASEERFDALLALGRHEEALAGLRVLAAEHPLRERTQSLLMLALYRSGRQPDALRAYEAYRTLLADELGLDPSPTLRGLERAMLDHALDPGRPSQPRTRPSGAESPSMLPRPVNRLVGRAAELAELEDLVTRHRVVTLAGPGGVGKTRLALEAAGVVSATGRRVAFCELAPVGRGEELAPAVATALGIEPRADAPVDAGLADALRGQHVLVVLDNCEHVVDAAAALVERLTEGTTTVHVLATSRERLAVAGEHVHTLSPLGDAAAIELFVERAQAVRAGFAPGDDDRGDLLYICHRLDGLPLALELAAARTQALSVHAIADALSQRFRLLTGGRRSEQRHRSLVEAIRWSFDLLDDDERGFCERLAVFVGGFTVDSAAAVAGIGTVDAAELVARLVERSLITVTPTPSGHRYGMLESVRHYGLDRLADRDELDGARRAHADHFVRFARQQDEALTVADLAGHALARVDDELANLRSTHAWLLQAADIDGLAELARRLYWFALLAFRPEVCTWTEGALAAVAADDPRRADMLTMACLGRWQRGDVAGAVQGIADGRRLAPVGSRAACYLVAHDGNMVGRTGDVDRAIRLFDECLALADPVQDPLIVAVNRFQRLLYGEIAGEATVAADAVRWASEAEAAGNPLVTCLAHYAAGEVLAETDPARATEHLDAALTAAAGSGCWFATAVAGVTRASIASRHGDLRDAAAAYRRLLDLWRRGALRPVESTMLRGVAELLASAGRPDAAAIVHGSVVASTVAPLFGPDAERQAELADRLAGQMGPAAFAAAAERGARLGDDEVLELTATALDSLA